MTLRTHRSALAWSFLIGMATLSLLGPLLGLRDPDAQEDVLGLRNVPPLTRMSTVERKDGTVHFAREVRVTEDGVEYLRGRDWQSEARENLAPDWRGRAWFFLGTDGFGRDLLSRVIHGARVSLAVGLLSAFSALFVGSAIGLAAGLFGGWIDGLLMRLTDLFLSIPRLFLALLLAQLYGPSIVTTVLVLAATTWMPAARLMRSQVSATRPLLFFEAARANGCNPLRLALFHLLPAAVRPLAIESALRVGDTILLESALSFLGLGVRAPTPSWGNIVADGQGSLSTAWWIAAAPGLAIAATVLALHAIGDPDEEPGSRYTGSDRARAHP